MTERKLADVLEAGLGPIPNAALERQAERWERSGTSDARRLLLERRRAAAGAMAGALAAATAMLLAVVLFRGPTEPVSAPVSAGSGSGARGAGTRAFESIRIEVPPNAQARSIAFGPGEMVSAEPGTRGSVARSTSSHTRVSLAEGTLALSLRRSPGKSWSVIAGPYHVEVIGTRFRVTWRAAASTLDVTVEQGRVRVHGGELGASGRELGTGEGLRAGLAGAPATSASAEPTPAPSRSTSASADWRTLRDERRYPEALAAANRAGFAHLCNMLGPGDLTALADVARLAGDPARTEQALTTLRRRFPGGREAATAAFLLGRLGTTPAHTRWLETYLVEQPGGPYEQEALGRLMASSHERGDRAGASARARRYLSAYPGGPYATHAHSILRDVGASVTDR